MIEVWAAITGYENTYEVSNQGRIRRLAPGPHTRPGFVLKSQINRGYPYVTLTKNNVPHAFSVHRLVCSAFFEGIPDGMQINHKNGDKTDCRLDNLEIVTPSENTLHAVHVLGKRGAPPPVFHGEKNHKAKLRASDILKIFKLREQGLSQQKIADVFGVYQTTISNVLRKKNWTHL